MEARTLIVGADGSPAAQNAIAWAAREASQTGARVVVVTAVDVNTQFARDLPPTGLFNWRRTLQDDLRKNWVRPLVEAGVTYSTRVVEDAAPDAIMGAADAEGADLIVIGTHGHGGFRDRLLGSVSYRVIHLARQPVTVIPPDWHPAELLAATGARTGGA
jgi:nucleotide-binding universal stress UspA family protein